MKRHMTYGSIQPIRKITLEVSTLHYSRDQLWWYNGVQSNKSAFERSGQMRLLPTEIKQSLFESDEKW